MEARTTHETPQTVRLGDLIAAVFDAAAGFSTDPREESRMATQAVKNLLRRARALGRGRLPRGELFMGIAVREKPKRLCRLAMRR